MLFSEVIGQESTKESLLQMVQQNRLSHALLFQSPEGSGGLPIAIAFAQYIVCTNKQNNDACGKCGACKRAAKLIHPDIHFSYPVIPRNSGDKPISADYMNEWREFVFQLPYGNSFDWLQSINAENKQGNIPVSECRDILRKLNLKSYEGGYKILIMWCTEFLGKEGNTLLKIIEEPPANTLFIFIAENTEMVLQTILSRTQLVKINPLSATDITHALMERSSLTETEAIRIAGMAEGNYRDALRLSQHDTSDFLEVLRKWLNAIILQKPLALQRWLDDMAGSKMGRENQKQFLRYFIMMIEHSIRMQYSPSETSLFPEEEQKFAKSLQKMADNIQLQKIIPLIEDACYHIERNANGKILFHALSIKLQKIFAKETVKE